MATRTGLLALAFGAIVASGSPAAQLEPVRPGQEPLIHRAIFADKQLWLLTDAGILSSIVDGRSDRAEAALPEPALDLWSNDGRPAVITCLRDSCTDWTLRERIAGQWTVAAKVSSQGDRPLAVSGAGGMTTLLTSRRVIEIVGDKQRAIELSRPLRARPIASVHITPASIFVGFNAGEWGGGLQRIDRQTGEVSTIERNASGQLCDGTLNTECDPVNGIATEPWKPECVVIAIGVVHLGAQRGRIAEICGDDVRRLYAKPYGRQLADRDTVLKPTEPFPSIAFFGSARWGNTLWAVGTDGLYQIGPDGATQSSSLPPFKQIGGLSVSFDLPDFVLVLTEVNQRWSVSGKTPILVPR